jgi:TolB-like protein
MKKGAFILLVIFNSFYIFSQNISLDSALEQGGQFVSESLPVGAKIGLLNFDTNENEELSEYIIDELTMHIVNIGKIVVVDRANLDVIRKEMAFQLSGEVSDESAQVIGKMLGAQTIVSGAMARLGDHYRFRIRLLSVETAQIQSMRAYNIGMDDNFAALLGSALSPNVPRVVQPVSPSPGAAVQNTPVQPVGRLTARVKLPTAETVSFGTSYASARFISQAIEVTRQYFRRYNPQVVEEMSDYAVVTAKYGKYNIDVYIVAQGSTCQIEVSSDIRDQDYVTKWIKNLEKELAKALE